MLDAGAVDILQADVTRCGGITNMLRVDALCKARSMPFSAHCCPAVFDAGSRAAYANDSSNFRQIPLGVVIPASIDDVVATHRACAEFGAPIVNRGGGTSLSGETVNRAIVIDCSKYLTWIGDVDLERRTVRCQPGAINEHVNRRTGAQSGLIFGPDPSTHDRCTIGGNLGNNSCGIHSVQAQLYGPGPRFSDCVRGLEVVTYDGERFSVGVGEEERLGDIIAAGGRKGRSTPSCATFATAAPTSSAHG